MRLKVGRGKTRNGLVGKLTKAEKYRQGHEAGTLTQEEYREAGKVKEGRFYFFDDGSCYNKGTGDCCMLTPEQARRQVADGSAELQRKFATLGLTLTDDGRIR